MIRKYVSEIDFSEKDVEVDDVQYYILKEISKLHPQSIPDFVYIDENGTPSIVIDRGATREDREIGKDKYRIKIEKI